MPARLGKLAAWLERHGVTIEKPGAGSHWKARFQDGSMYPIPAHNALRTEISDKYLKAIAKLMGTTLAELLREL
jgi:arsenate reductase-like glutaredoxin family protein